MGIKRRAPLLRDAKAGCDEGCKVKHATSEEANYTHIK